MKSARFELRPCPCGRPAVKMSVGEPACQICLDIEAGLARYHHRHHLPEAERLLEISSRLDPSSVKAAVARGYRRFVRHYLYQGHP